MRVSEEAAAVETSAAPSEKQPGLTPDQVVCQKLQEAANTIIAQHCDIVRTIAVCVDYHGGLNDAPLAKGIWQGNDGPAHKATEILGSLHSCVNLLGTMTERAIQLVQHIEESLRQRLEQLRDLEAQHKPQETTSPSSS